MSLFRPVSLHFTGVIRWGLSVFLGLGLTVPLAAETPAAIADFDVNATIVKGCWITNLGQSGDMGSAGTLNFGVVPVTDTGIRTAQTAGTQSFSMRCTPETPLRVRVDGGKNAFASTRRMRLGTSGPYLPYFLCSDPACTILITVPYDVSTVLTAAQAQAITLHYYGSTTVPAGLPPGVYTDEVTITYSW